MGVITEATTRGRDEWHRKRWGYPEQLTAEQEQLMIGSLLGDGCLFRRKGKGNPVYTAVHSNRQRSYLEWKAEVFSAFRPNIRFTDTRGQFMTGAPAAFWPYYNAFYPGSPKIIPDLALTRLSELGLAVWLMDDGSLQQRRHFHLCTDAWPLEEQERLCRWFERRWNLSPVPQSMKATDSYRLRFRVNDSVDLLQLVKPFLHPFFHAKWEADNVERWRHSPSRKEIIAKANEKRAELIRAGILKVGYHTGTLRVDPDAS